MILPGTRAQIVRQYQAGQSVASLMAEFRVGRGTIYGALADAKVPMRARGRHDEDSPNEYQATRRAMGVLRSRRWSDKLIGRAFGIDAGVVARILLGESIPTKPKPAI